MAIWHVTVNGDPACTSPLVSADERIEPPACGSRSAERAEQYAAMLRALHPGARIDVVPQGCPMRGE